MGALAFVCTVCKLHRSTDSLPGRYLAAVRARCAGLGSVKDACEPVIMMLVSYRPLGAGVLLALLERYMRADRGDEGSVGPTALNPFYSVLEGEMPAIARPREALWRP